MATATTPDGRPSAWGFLKSELSGALRATWRGLWRGWLVLTLLAGLWISTLTVGEAYARDGLGDAVLALGVALGFGAYLALFPALAVAAAALAWRLFGWATVFVLVVGPLAFMGVFWLSRGWLVSLTQDVVEAYVASFRAHDFPVTKLAAVELLEGLKVAHAGPLALPLLAVLIVPLVPALLGDLLLVGLDGAVLWELAQWGLGLGLVLALAAVLALVLCAPPLLVALVMRARRRWREYASGGATGARDGAVSGGG